MKKKFTFLTLALSLLGLTNNANATDYELYIGGVQVTSDNASNILAGTDNDGKASYNASTQTLTLNGLNLTSEKICIKNDIEGGLTIDLIGQNTLKTKPQFTNVIQSYKNLTITGSGALNIETLNKNSNGIYLFYSELSNADLVIKNTTVTIKSLYNGIKAQLSSQSPIFRSSLTIDNSTVKIASENYIFADLKSINLVGCSVTKPTDAYVKDGYAWLDSKWLSDSELWIEPVKYYDLYIADIVVTSANKDNILAGTANDGKVRFDPETSTLTLDNANINFESGSIIQSDIEITVNLKGTNRLNGKYSIFEANGDITFTGDGELEAVSELGSLIEGGYYDVNITNTKFSGSGNWGIVNVNKLTIENSAVAVTGSEGSIANINEMELKDCSIKTPIGAEYVAEKQAVCIDGEIVTAEITIAPETSLPTATKYDLWVAGVQVTSDNASNILAGTENDGKVSYTENYEYNGKLTFKNANIETLQIGIDNKIPELCISFVGTNTIKSMGNYAIRTNVDLRIRDNSGVFNAESVGSTAIYVTNGAELEIRQAIVTAVSTGAYGIRGTGLDETLIIEEAMVNATGTKGSICDFKDITLEDCLIISPIGAQVSNGAIKLNNEIVTSEVKIYAPQEYSLIVEDVFVTDANKDNILAGTDNDGKVSYNPATATLTLNGANLKTKKPDPDAEIVFGIQSGIAGFTIELQNTNTITFDLEDVYQGGFVYCLNLTIKDSGKLILNANKPVLMIGLVCEESLTIENTNLEMNGTMYVGMTGNPEVNIGLTIKNSNVKIAPTQLASITGFTSFEMEGCTIVSPEGATYGEGIVPMIDPQDKVPALVKNGAVVTEEVVIERTADAIQTVLNENVLLVVRDRQLTVENAQNLPISIYNLMGQAVASKRNCSNSEVFTLPNAGIYVVKCGKGAEKIIVK